MPEPRDLNSIERLMLFRAWGKSCVWCKRSLRYDEVEVDHIVAKSLQGEKLRDTLKLYGLDNSFDIHALQNLVPSCRRCNGSKGNRPVRTAPAFLAILDKAQVRAQKVTNKAARFTRDGALAEIAQLVQAIGLTPQELVSLNQLAQPGRRPSAGTCYDYEPELPKLKRSKKRLGHQWLSDDEQMLDLLESWAVNHNDDALQIIEDTFGGGDTPPQRASPIRVDFLAYASELGDFLANVTFHVDYLFITDDLNEMAEAEHTVDLWITLDPARQQVVDVTVDNFNTLDTWSRRRRSAVAR